MKKAQVDKKDPAPVAPATPTVSPPVKEPANDVSDQKAHDEHPKKRHHILRIRKVKNCNEKCKKFCAIATYVVLGAITIMISIGAIIITSLASVTTKIYDTEQSSRLVAMVMLAATAAITLTVVICAQVGAVRNKTKAVYSAGLVMLILAIMQAVIIGVAINVTEADELSIGKALTSSFLLAKEGNSKHVKLWSATQSDLSCCGLYGPEDYRNPSMPYNFPPTVPISCCPSYDANKPLHGQERQRESCKVNGTYYPVGCNGLVLEVFKTTSSAVIGVIVVLIVLEVILTVLGASLIRKKKSEQNQEYDDVEIHEVPAH